MAPLPCIGPDDSDERPGRNEYSAIGVVAAVTLRAIVVATLALGLAGCSGGSEDPRTDRAGGKEATAGAVAVSRPPRTGTCPLTLPNGNVPPGPDVGANHGNGRLWTAMWPHNVVIATPPYIGRGGSVQMKWPWWWRGVRGKLAITGRRLDADARPLSAYLPEGYDDGFLPSGLTFPTEGCREVTGAIGETELTFVTLILKASRYWPAPGDG